MGEALTSVASPAVALFAIYAVHRLTKSREREKSVFELYKTVGDAIAALKAATIKAWTEPQGGTREAAVAETMWRLQQIGGYVERIRRMSRHWAFRGIATPRAIGWEPPVIAPDMPWSSYEALLHRATLGALWILKWGRHLLWPPRWTIEIRVTSAMKDLRNLITGDPFDDPTRAPDLTQGVAVEAAVGTFLQSLDEQLFGWMD